MMKITYINHSGFLIETKDCYYIFDYYKGELPLLDKKKEVIVFCSHFHKDHFNPVIFEILDDMSMTYQAILAKDIRKRKHLSDMKITYVYHDQTYNLDNGTQVDTLLSNDSGVAFIVKTKEGTIYHAGDLNDWYWDGEPKADNQRLTSAYRAEIRKIKGMHFDAAFVPLDPRQGDHYADAVSYTHLDYKEISFVCLRPDGSLELPSTLGIVCRKIAQKLDGFEGFHFHQLRHTYTSNLLANGAAPKDVQELLGHSDVSTTMNVYAHSTRKAKRESARLLDKVAGND